MEIPADILKKVDEVLKKRAAQKEAERRSDEMRVKEVRELKDLKKAHYAESLKRAEAILAWVKMFVADAGSKKIFRAIDDVNIFVANFWGGKPQLGKIYASWARIVLSKEGRLRYEEVYKGHSSSVTHLGSCPPSPSVLVDGLHPEFLKQWEAAIQKNVVWGYVRNSLPKYF